MTNTRPSTTLSSLLRDGFEVVAAAGADMPGQSDERPLAGLSVREMPRLMHDANVSLADQDELLAAVIRCYRRAPRSGWSAVLLEMLSPMLVGVGRRLAFVPAGVAPEDLDHQLIAEALFVARTFAMPRSTRYVQRWLEARLLRRMTRWLGAAEHERTESLEQVADDELTSNDAAETSLDGLVDSGVPREDLVLLYRSRVHGVTARELADEMGISVAEVTNRQRRALRRLRSWAPAHFRRLSGGIPAVA
jgi:DNA-directed RNA polymerase specialized sigma24 family protein